MPWSHPAFMLPNFMVPHLITWQWSWIDSLHHYTLLYFNFQIPLPVCNKVSHCHLPPKPMHMVFIQPVIQLQHTLTWILKCMDTSVCLCEKPHRSCWDFHGLFGDPRNSFTWCFSMNGKITLENPVPLLCGPGRVKMGVLTHLRIQTLIPSVSSE